MRWPIGEYAHEFYCSFVPPPLALVEAASRRLAFRGFDDAAPAPEWEPLPPGIYTARIVSGTLAQTKKGDDAYRMVFEVSEGEQRTRRVSRTWTFTRKALAYAKRDLATFGLTTSQKLLELFRPSAGKFTSNSWLPCNGAMTASHSTT